MIVRLLDMTLLGLGTLLLLACVVRAETRRSMQASLLASSDSRGHKLWHPPEKEAPAVQQVVNESSERISDGTTNATDCNLAADTEPDWVAMAYALSRSHLEREWPSQWSLDLPCNIAAPGKVGFVDKLAHYLDRPNRNLLPVYRENKIPLYEGCLMYMSDRHNFIYLRQPKSSSTAVIMGLVREFCAGYKDTDSNRPIKEYCEPDEFRKVGDPKNVDREKWQKSFVFTVVRNPWTRMLSAYHMFSDNWLHRNEPENHKQAKESCGMPFKEFSEDSANMLDLCESSVGCCAFWQKNGVDWEFVGNSFTRVHISAQHHCVFLPDGTSMVDYIGTTETIDEDWPTMVGAIRERNGTTATDDNRNIVGLSRVDPLAIFSNKTAETQSGEQKPNKKAKDCDPEKTRSTLDEAALYNIAWQYALDVKRFGYL